MTYTINAYALDVERELVATYDKLKVCSDDERAELEALRDHYRGVLAQMVESAIKVKRPRRAIADRLERD